MGIPRATTFKMAGGAQQTEPFSLRLSPPRLNISLCCAHFTLPRYWGWGGTTTKAIAAAQAVACRPGGTFAGRDGADGALGLLALCLLHLGLEVAVELFVPQEAGGDALLQFLRGGWWQSPPATGVAGVSVHSVRAPRRQWPPFCLFQFQNTQQHFVTRIF